MLLASTPPIYPVSEFTPLTKHLDFGSDTKFTVKEISKAQKRLEEKIDLIVKHLEDDLTPKQLTAAINQERNSISPVSILFEAQSESDIEYPDNQNSGVQSPLSTAETGTQTHSQYNNRWTQTDSAYRSEFPQTHIVSNNILRT
jgi:hypothetical protein